MGRREIPGDRRRGLAMMPWGARLASWSSHVVRLAMVMRFLLTEDQSEGDGGGTRWLGLGDWKGKVINLAGVTAHHPLAPFP